MRTLKNLITQFNHPSYKKWAARVAFTTFVHDMIIINTNL